jgi:hypothetical protein
MEEGATDGEAVARRLAALPALPMRRATLAALLCQLSVEEATRLCGELVRRGREGPPFDAALLALGAVLDAGDLGYERHGEIYARARHLDDGPLARLMLSAQPPPPGSPPPIAIPGRPELTLGERKSLARGRERELLERLLYDPDESVLEILLGNPRITEEDVIRLASRRPTTQAAQRAIFRCERFIVRYAVRRALVLNPFTPTDLAARVSALLTRTDLRHVAEDPSLALTVRDAARDLLERRRGA